MPFGPCGQGVNNRATYEATMPATSRTPHQPERKVAATMPATMTTVAMATSHPGGCDAEPVTPCDPPFGPYTANPTSTPAIARSSTSSADSPGWRSVTPRTSAYRAKATPRAAETGARRGHGRPLRRDETAFVVT